MWQQQHHVVGYQMIQLVSPPCAVFFKTLMLKFSCILQTCFSVSWFHNPEGLKPLGDLQAERVLSLSEEFLVEVFHFIREEPLPVNPPRPSWPCPVSPLITVETSSLCRKTLTWSSILLLLFLTQFQTVLSPLFGSTCKQNNSLVPFFFLVDHKPLNIKTTHWNQLIIVNVSVLFIQKNCSSSVYFSSVLQGPI